MRTLDLMVDIDEVVFPLIDGIHALAQAEGLHDGTAIPQWEGWKSYNCTPDRYWQLWETFSLNDGYLSTEPYVGAPEALRWMMWEGHRIHLVTARGFFTNGDDVRAWTEKWLEEYAIPHTSLTFSKDKPGTQIHLGVDFDAAIDDSPKNYQELVDSGVPTWLMNHAHNREFDAQHRVDTLWEWAYQLEKRYPS